MSLLDSIKKKIQTKTQSNARGKKQGVNAKSGVLPTRKEASVKKETTAFTQRTHAGASVYHKKYALDMLLHPYVTEKASGLKAAGNKYVFKVAGFANKVELRKVVQEKFKVVVTKINIINIPRKSMRIGKTLGTKPGFKKAIITLKEGNTIETGV